MPLEELVWVHHLLVWQCLLNHLQLLQAPLALPVNDLDQLASSQHSATPLVGLVHEELQLMLLQARFLHVQLSRLDCLTNLHPIVLGCLHVIFLL